MSQTEVETAAIAPEAPSSPAIGRSMPASPSRSAPAPAGPLPRYSLALVSSLHALVLGAAALVLPWHGGAPASVVLFALAALHVVTAGLALARRDRALRMAWQVLALASLLVLLAATVAMASAALYLAELYQGIGQAVAGGLAVFWGLLVLVTVPVACWGLAVTGFRLRAKSGGALAALLAVALVSAGTARAAAVAQPVAGAQGPELTTQLEGALRAYGEGKREAEGSLFQREPMDCPAPITTEQITLFVAYLGQDGGPHGACLQRASAPELASALQELLAERSRPGGAVKLDLVRSLRALHAVHPLLDALTLRPGLDGACLHQRCLMPWQLVGLDLFTKHRPLPAVRDMSFGFSPETLAELLGSPSASLSEIASIETWSAALTRGKVTELTRLRPTPAPLTPQTLTWARQHAESHILSAQRREGNFRYLLDPFTGPRPEEAEANLPRQAGTMLVLCEVGKDSHTNAAVARALAWLAGFERRVGELSWLSSTGVDAELGPTALPLAAFLSCRERAGSDHDVLIARLGRFLLRLQRPDGSFFPEFDPARQEPVGQYEPLYATGQAVLALVLLERFAQTADVPDLPEKERIAEAIDRAMDFYAERWPRALRDFFFLEENWHCLAARAAVPSHRRDAYERFCLDYIGFKSRLILHEGAVPEFVGGYGLGNMFPPHYTATSGFGEALSAAIAVESARGGDVQAKRALLREVLGFLTRAQWSVPACFACTTLQPVIGGFSEHVASPIIRIDYVQHALAALGHGERALGEEPAR